MRFVACVPVLLIVFTGVSVTDASEWTYDLRGSDWTGECQSGKKQSPIELSLKSAKEREFDHLRLADYGQLVPAILKNNGHTAELRLNVTQDSKPEASGGGLPLTYQLENLHFHWQSEHKIEGQRFPLELHLVHYAKEYDNFTNALNYPNGVAVFAVMFEYSPDDDDDFEPLLNVIQQLQTRVDVSETLQQFSVKNFLPRDVAGFYRYEGSLTTPDCNEDVIWTVFTNTMPISANQVAIFEAMETERSTVLKENYRSIQPLNGRDVYVKISPIRGSAEMNEVPFILLTTSILILSFFKL